MNMTRRAAAEFFGTFWLVFGGCGAAVLATNTNLYPSGLGIGFVGVAFAFGLTVLTMAYAVGHISGGHFNPAVTVGLACSGRFAPKDIVPYWAAQVLGAICAAGVLFVIAGGLPNFDAGGFASNGFGDTPGSPGHYSMAAALTCEFVMTFFFLLIILGATDKLAASGFAPIAIGLGLTLIHLVSIPVTNTSVNPARSTGPALFAGGWALSQLWLFWIAPLAGAALAGVAHRSLFASAAAKPELEEQRREGPPPLRRVA